MEIEIKLANITKEKVDAIVHPANSYMTMGGGLARVIREVGGEEINEDALKFIPVPVGKAVITDGRKLASKFVIHAPTMEQGSSPTTVEKVRLAAQAILDCAEENNLESVAIPGLGTGVGKVPKDQAAKIMVETIKAHKGNIKKVILIDEDVELVEQFKLQVVQ